MGEADILAALMAMPGQWMDRIRQRRDWCVDRYSNVSSVVPAVLVGSGG